MNATCHKHMCVTSRAEAMPGLIVLDAATREEEQTEREEGSIRCACAFAELRWRQGIGKLLGEFESALHGHVIATDAINVCHSGCTGRKPQAPSLIAAM